MYALSDSHSAMSGGLFFFPRKLDLLAFQMIFKTNQIFVAYRNTIARTIVGTLLSLTITSLTAYPLSIRRFKGRNVISMLIFFTMLFSGGMIPTFLLVQSLGMLDTFWALVVPGMMSAYNMFILRNYFQSLPASLEESAHIDGANAFVVLTRIILPISTPALAAIAMFYGVGHWNSYMDGILYINTPNLQILQVYLRTLLMSTGAMNSLSGVSNQAEAANKLTEESMKMATIAVSVLPILVVYPFLQRYYTKGITVGAVKG
jgi:putative aldouronate transport system permease protein